MIIWRQKFLPLTGHKAVFLAGILFVRKEAKMNERDLNHERIHSRQFVELMVLFAVATVFIRWWLPVFAPFAFYVWYIVEWLIRLLKKGNAYRNISFEREAYANENYSDYLSERELFAFLEYL